MNLLNRLFNFLAPPAPQRYVPIRARCRRCGEVLEGRVDLYNELSLADDGVNYYCRKVLQGQGRCFQRVEVQLTFNAQRRLKSQSAEGGELV